jgi:nucleoside-diphosphate-sugar epimerase
MRILVTGHLGYIGSVLTGMLIDRKHAVLGLDTGYFERCVIGEAPVPLEREIRKDVRAIEADDLTCLDAVVHLAALSNDPMGEIDPGLTDQINHLGTLRLARKAREAGVSRFVFSSSCSMYGASEESAPLTELASFNPVSAYAWSKVHSEEGLRALADDRFSPIYLRNGTAYGASPRLRFDLVLNNLMGWALSTRSIRITSDGSPWRPLVHVRDICAAVVAVLEAPRDAIHNEAFNVGHEGENYQVRDIAEIVMRTVPGCEVQYTGEATNDRRSYRVSFEKIADRLPDFRPEWTVERGAEELRDLLSRHAFSQDMFQDRRFTRLAQLKHLLAEGSLDPNLAWASAEEGA